MIPDNRTAYAFVVLPGLIAGVVLHTAAQQVYIVNEPDVLRVYFGLKMTKTADLTTA